MTDNELVRIWQSSPNQERVKFEKSRLMIDVQSSMDRFHRSVKLRDVTEQIGIAVVIPAFAYIAYSTPQVVSKIAAILIVAWAIFVFIKLRNAKRQKPGTFTETYLDYLYKTRKYLLLQKELLDTIVYWYILPCFLLINILLISKIGVSGRIKEIFKFFSVNVLGAVFIYIINKRAVKRKFIPRIEKVNKLINMIENE